eukprot:TRINITY_DN4150_c0_g1_i1.p2 TRINITY_DN4150_c0_g1~~TRINITY_DN4150_c0_g1_i1.p2  ORF type:complete len:65 (+),score=11.17 TRINITY_DN4150_c0_g1_i1:230-424(+)
MRDALDVFIADALLDADVFFRYSGGIVLRVVSPLGSRCLSSSMFAHVLCVDTGRSSETAKAHRG